MLRELRIVVVAVAVSSMCSVVGIAAEPKSDHRFEFRRNDDSAVVMVEKERTVFVVTSPSGIGGVTITRGDEPWPENVTLRLRYAKARGFRVLESLTLRTDRMLVRSDSKSSGRMPFYFRGADKESRKADPREGNESDGLLNVKVVAGGNGLDLVLPANMLRGSDELVVAWIDFYRT